MPFVGKALVVKEQYGPEYRFIGRGGGQHVFRVDPGGDREFEFMLFAGWSEGAVHNNPGDFNAYVKRSALEFNHPLESRYVAMEKKD